MARVVIPTKDGQYTNTDEWATGKPGQIVNFLIDEVGTLTSRPGLLAFVDPTDAAVGMHSNNDQRIIGLTAYKDRLIAVRANRRVFEITSAGVARDITTDFLGGSQTPTFLLEGGTHPSQAGRLLIFGGGEPLEVTPGLLCRRFVVGSAPAATHGAVLQSTLVLNDYGTQVIRYSTPTNHNDFANSDKAAVDTATVTSINGSTYSLSDGTTLTALTVIGGGTVNVNGKVGDVVVTLDDGTRVLANGYSGFFQAYSNPDAVTAIKAFRNRLWIFGPSSLEMYYGTGDLAAPFGSRDMPPSSSVSAPYSVIEADDSLWWLDGDRRVTRMTDGLRVVSLPIEAQLKAMSMVSDCVTHQMNWQGHHLLLFHFERAAVTMVYDYVRDVWTEWRQWSNAPGAAGWQAMPLTAYAYQPEWDRHFCAGGSSGQIFELSATTYEDNGNPLVRLWRGPYFDGGDSALKFCRRMQLVVDGGVATGYTASGATNGANETYNPEVEVRWRNEDRQWQDWRQVSLGRVGYQDTVRDLWCRTSYRRQQIELRCSAPVALRLHRIELELDARLR